MEAKVLAVDEVGAVTTRSIPPYLVMHATGRVSSGGWMNGKLLPATYIQEPPDGIWDFDFVATMPSGPAINVILPISANITLQLPKWCKGIRIHASSNFMEQILFQDPEEVAIPASWVPDPWKRSDQPNEARLETMVAASPKGDPGDNWLWSVSPSAFDVANQRTLSLVRDSSRSLDGPLSSLVGTAIRIFHEGDMITMDHRPDRFNVELEKSGNVVVRVFFG